MSKVKLSALWPAWIALTVAVTAKPYWWHLEYFRHPGPRFFALYLGFLAALAAGSFLYVRLRRLRPAWVAWEPRIFAGFFLAFFLFYAPVATLYALWIGFVCFGLGRLALGRMTESALEQLTLWPAAGLGFLSALMFTLGLAHLYYRWVILVLLAVAALAFRRNARTLRDLWRRAEAGYVACAEDPLWGLCLVFLFVATVSSAMVALSPEIAFDPVSFHFVYARHYAQHHQLAAMAWLPASYRPQNVEILYTLGFLLDGQAAAKVLTYAFFPLSALSLVLIGRRWFTGTAGLVGAALLATTPFISWEGSVAKNDLALALDLLLALYGVVRWTETNRFGWLAVGVLFLGFGFGVKHVAILGAVPLALLALWNLRQLRLTSRQAAALAAIFVCAGLYWHIRTFLLVGRPIYPEALASAVESTTAIGHPQLSRLERLGIYVTVPWRVHFRGMYAFDSPSPNPCGFILVAFFPFLFVPGGLRTRGARLLLFFAAGYFLYWAAIVIQLRFVIAALGVLLVYLADRLCAVSRRSSFLRCLVLALAAYCLAFSLTLTLILEMNVPRLQLFARRITPEQFLRQSLITYGSIEALNLAAHPGEVAYAVGNCSTFYSTIEFHCYYDANGVYSLEQVAQDLGAARYHYLLVSDSWAEPQHLRVVEHLYHPLLLYQDQYFRLYRLRQQMVHGH